MISEPFFEKTMGAIKRSSVKDALVSKLVESAILASLKMKGSAATLLILVLCAVTMVIVSSGAASSSSVDELTDPCQDKPSPSSPPLFSPL